MSCSRADDVAWHGTVWRGEGSRGARRCAAKTPVGCDPTGKSSTEKRAVARQVAKGARVRGQRRQSHTPYPIPPSGGCGQPRAAASVEHASARRSASQTTYLCDVYLRAHAGDAHVGGIGRHAHAAGSRPAAVGSHRIWAVVCLFEVSFAFQGCFNKGLLAQSQMFSQISRISYRGSVFFRPHFR